MKRLRSPKACCAAAVRADATAVFCEECGQPLARCMAFAECGGLVGDDGLCHVCVDPHLQIIPGATMNAPVGGSVALPFDLYNSSSIDRPLFVTGLWSREKGDWREERLGWETLDPGTRAPASVTAQEFDRAGLHEVEIMWTVATRWRARQENFAFSTRVLLTIPSNTGAGAAGPVVQISSENAMNGNVIQITDNTSRGAADDGKVVSALDMNIHRLDVEERRMGLRGITEDLRVPRSVAFRFAGFGKKETPALELPIATPDGILAFGRSDARAAGGEGDVHLAVTDQDGAVNTDQTLTLSRRHFEMYVENDRLMLRASGRNGLRVNGSAIGPNKTAPLKDGDVIEPLVKMPGALKLTVQFATEFDRVSVVTVTRSPAIQESAA